MRTEWKWALTGYFTSLFFHEIPAGEKEGLALQAENMSLDANNIVSYCLLFMWPYTTPFYCSLFSLFCFLGTQTICGKGMSCWFSIYILILSQYIFMACGACHFRECATCHFFRDKLNVASAGVCEAIEQEIRRKYIMQLWSEPGLGTNFSVKNQGARNMAILVRYTIIMSKDQIKLF